MSLAPLVKTAFKIGALVVAVGMLGGYLWMTQRELPKPNATGTPTPGPAPEFDPRVTSKSAVIVGPAVLDPSLSATPAFDPPITSKSLQVVKPQTAEKLNLAPAPREPRISSKVGSVIRSRLPDSKSQPVLKNEEEVVETIIGPELTPSPTPTPPPQLNAPANP